MEPNETAENPGAYTKTVMNKVEKSLCSPPAQPLTPFERKVVFETVRAVERGMR